MKPIELIEQALINSSDTGAIVLDPFGGSGSTLIASHRQRRTAYVCEIAPRYCEVILQRAEVEGMTVSFAENIL